ncbi:MAG: Asp-tRNA(Asn)/Glu-tRNA(Gln) amidotransferase subunit GatC [Candidatus Adiutrix sp.]|jgi:aspartyl-tRNA(Asn)/glutamyl-tRNA(Gln) amidotransferase subunit C|nr:Asp-tRNA(Asn)/Glu-tRNA(Gln) amidotransferase subunit GatC [Candidatus Adiutrix sp.]
MTLDQKTAERIAELARLHFDKDPAAAARLAKELSGIVKAMDILNEADVAGVEPLYSPLAEVAGPRPDEPGRGAEPEALLDQAPERVGRFFAVPKII